jgi:hypothetical protein
VTKSEYRKKVNEYKAYFLEKGMRLRIEKGDFKTNTCLVNGELQVFINRRLNEKEQINYIESIRSQQLTDLMPSNQTVEE